MSGSANTRPDRRLEREFGPEVSPPRLPIEHVDDLGYPDERVVCQRVSLHPSLLQFDVVSDDGACVRHNHDGHGGPAVVGDGHGGHAESGGIAVRDDHDLGHTGTQAPAEMSTLFPDLKAFWAAENIVATIHNTYTLRGALVRDALEWSRQINRALYLFGREGEVMFASHSWPRRGIDRIQEVMRTQRDTCAHLNNGVLHLANQGVTINEIHNEYRVPASLQQQWPARSYHGSVEHNTRAVVNRYLGSWDGNPTTLIPFVAGRFRTAVRRVDGRRGADPGQGPGTGRSRAVPAGDRDPGQAASRRAWQRRGPAVVGRRLRTGRLPAGEPECSQQLPGRGL